MIDLEHMATARRISEISPDPSTKCGAVLVSNVSGVLGTGYNAPPVAFLEALDEEQRTMKGRQGVGPLELMYLHNRDFRLSVTVHAEINALTDAIVSGNLQGPVRSSKLTMYVWPIPSCGPCMARMVQEGISRVVSLAPDFEHARRWGDSWHHAAIIASTCDTQLVQVLPKDFDNWEKENA